MTFFLVTEDQVAAAGKYIASVRPLHRVLGPVCEVSDCDERRSGKSPYCKKHAMRAKRHGDPTIIKRPWDQKKGL